MSLKTKINIGLCIIIVIGIFIFYYSGFKGTPWGRDAHEQKVSEYLQEHHGDVFTIADTTYHFLDCPACYTTTYYYNVAPDALFRIQYVPRTIAPDYWALTHEDLRGRERATAFLLTHEPFTESQFKTVSGADEFIDYARVISGVDREESSIAQYFRLTPEDVQISTYDIIPNGLELNNRRSYHFSQLSGFEHLLHFIDGRIDQNMSDHIYHHPLYNYTSVIDMLDYMAEKKIYIVPTYSNIEFVLNELKEGRPVLYKERSFDGQSNLLNMKKDVNGNIITNDDFYSVNFTWYVLYGHKEDRVLGFNTTQAQITSLGVNDLLSGPMRHPHFRFSYDWTPIFVNHNESESELRNFFIFPEINGSVQDEGNALYILVDDTETYELLLQDSLLYKQWKNIDFFYKGMDYSYRENESFQQEYASFINEIEQLGKEKLFAFEYASYYLFMDPQPYKAKPYIDYLLENQNQVDQQGRRTRDFIFYQELMLHYDLFTGNNSAVLEHTRNIQEYLSLDLPPSQNYSRSYSLIEYLREETLVAMAESLIAEERFHFTRGVVTVLERKNPEHPKLEQLREAVSR